MFLTIEDLVTLTGRKKPKLQRQWLADAGYKFDVRADGRPVVLTSQVEAKLHGRRRRSADEPDFSSLEAQS